MPTLETLLTEIRACRHCTHAHAGHKSPMTVEPNPVLQLSSRSKIRIIGQAPGNLAHQSSRPFTDPSGVRLREWLGVDDAAFYNSDNFAVTPIGFCFPGNDKNGGDLPPRKECAPLWHDKVSTHLNHVELTLLVGLYAQKAYLGRAAHPTLTETVRHWRSYGPDVIPLPHPSWRNTPWIKKNRWFEDVLVELKARVNAVLG